MIAYNKDWLYNIYIREQAAEALHTGCINTDRYEQLKERNPVKFYSPNIYATIALGLLTFVIVTFATSFLGLIIQPEKSIAAFCIFMGIACYAATEYIIGQNNHYNSGVDNVMVWASAGFFIAAAAAGFHFFDYGYSKQWHANAMVSFAAVLVCGFLAIRFVDTFLSIAALIALLCFVYFAIGFTNMVVSVILPFIIMLLSAAVFIIANKYAFTLVLYRTCLRYVKITALLGFYAAGNYYMLLNFNPLLFAKLGTLAVGFAWLWTLGVPLVYLFIGIKRKDILFLRTSLIVLAAGVVTFKLYHHVLSQEAALLLAGFILIVASYSLIRYLKTPKDGFTFAPEAVVNDRPELDKLLTGHMIDNANGGGSAGQGNGWG